MIYETIRTKSKRGNPMQCAQCLKQIKPGQKYLDIRTFGNGSFFHDQEHLSCRELCEEIDTAINDGTYDELDGVMMLHEMRYEIAGCWLAKTDEGRGLLCRLMGVLG